MPTIYHPKESSAEPDSQGVQSSIESLTFSDFVRMEQIDKEVGFQSIVPASVCFEQYQKFPKYICTIRVGGEIAGYACVLALKRDIYYKLREAEITELEITADDLDFESSPVHLLIQCVALSPKYRSLENIRKLFSKFRNHMRALVQEGMQIEEAMAECTSVKGLAMATRLLGMRPYKQCANGMIHVVGGEELSEVILA